MSSQGEDDPVEVGTVVTLALKHHQTASDGKNGMRDKIKNLVEEQAACKASRKKVLKELKNERRKRNRLLNKTRGLSDADLIELLRDRHDKLGEDSVSPSPAEGDGLTGAPGKASSSGGAP